MDRRLEVVERMEGVGRLYRGDVRLGTVRYRLAVYVEIQEAAAGSSKGVQAAEGWIVEAVGDEAIDTFDLAMTGRPYLTLELEDGRRWDFVMNIDGHGVSAGEGLR